MVNSLQDNQSDDNLGALDDALRVIQASLKEGGPEVDPVILMAYIDKKLTAEEMIVVERLTRTWNDWFWAKLQLEGLALEVDGILDESDADLHLGITTTQEEVGQRVHSIASDGSDTTEVRE